MKRTIDEHEARFDEVAAEYDELTRPVYRDCVDRVIAGVDPRPADVVLDIGAGTGVISLALADRADRVVGRDISEAMLAQARQKAAQAGITNVEFDYGSFLEPAYDGDATIVTSNYAMHHLDDAGKRAALDIIASYQPRRFVLGDLMFFGDPDPEYPEYDPDVDDPSTAGWLAAAITAVGFEIVDIHIVSDHVGVIVADEPREGWNE